MGRWTPCLGSEALVQGPVVGGRLPIGSRSRSGPGGSQRGWGGSQGGEASLWGISRAAGTHGPCHPPTLPYCPLWLPVCPVPPSSHLSYRLLCRLSPWSPSRLVLCSGSCVPLAFPQALPTSRSHPAAQQSGLAPGPNLTDLPGPSALSRAWSLARGGGCVPPSLWWVVRAGVGANSWLRKGGGGVAFGPLASPAASWDLRVADSGGAGRLEKNDSLSWHEKRPCESRTCAPGRRKGSSTCPTVPSRWGAGAQGQRPGHSLGCSGVAPPELGREATCKGSCQDGPAQRQPLRAQTLWQVPAAGKQQGVSGGFSKSTAGPGQVVRGRGQQ